MMGESLRQHSIQSAAPDTVKALEATSAAMANAQRELSTAWQAGVAPSTPE
jgi:hypothetical protein